MGVVDALALVAILHRTWPDWLVGLGIAALFLYLARHVLGQARYRFSREPDLLN
jgi:Co/Zn/Cd efflux system component